VSSEAWSEPENGRVKRDKSLPAETNNIRHGKAPPREREDDHKKSKEKKKKRHKEKDREHNHNR
jgi:hypothetical protein